MWPSLKLTLCCLICQTLGMSNGFRQLIDSPARQVDSLKNFENRDSSFVTNEVLSNMLNSPKSLQHRLFDNYFVQDSSRKSFPSAGGKITDTGMTNGELFLPYVNGQIEKPSFSMGDIVEIPKTLSLEGNAVSLSTHPSLGRSKRYRGAVADRLAHGFGKRSELGNAKRVSDNAKDYFLNSIRDILKTELIRRLILSDDYGQIVDYLDALNDKVKGTRLNRLDVNSDVPSNTGNTELQVPNLLRSVNNQDDSFYGNEDFGDSYTAE